MENLVQRLNQVKDRSDARHLFLALEGIYNRLSSVCLSSAGLVIKAPGSALVKAAEHYLCNSKWHVSDENCQY